MNSESWSFRKEVERVLDVYARYRDEDAYKSIWSPFDEVEATYRAQQCLTFAGLMREAGFVDLEGLRILDVGCGNGRVLRSFLDMGAKADDLHGIDIRREVIDAATSLSSHIDFCAFDGSTIDFPNHHFDLVTQFVVFSSIGMSELRFQLAAEMIRVLKSGGYLFWWDMSHMAAHAGGHNRPLDASALFRNMPVKLLEVGLHPAPSKCLRPIRGISRLIGPVLDKLQYPSTHVAALFGPKP